MTAPTAAEPAFRCRRCGEMQPASAFYRQPSRGFRRYSWCKACMTAYSSVRSAAQTASRAAARRRWGMW